MWTGRQSKAAACATRLILLALMAGWAAVAQGQGTLEAGVKAAYLYKFAPFVQWPAGAVQEPAGPFSICIVGNDPFGATLDRIVEGQRVGAHAIVVLRMTTAEPNSPCPIMFLGGSRAQSVKAALTAMEGKPVLTVTDSQTRPGIIDFSIDQGRVRFRVDDEAAARNGLSISSKLLSLAVSVKPRTAAGAP